jgi:3-oxoacyl-[acyl-carrier-protein] synthase III
MHRSEPIILRINQMVAQLIGLRPEKMHNNIQKYGNTTATSPSSPDPEKQFQRSVGSIRPKCSVVSNLSGSTWSAAAG